MVSLLSRILYSRENVFPLKVRIIIQNLLEVRAGTQQLKNIAHANSHPADAGSTAALLRIESDPVEEMSRHNAFSLT